MVDICKKKFEKLKIAFLIQNAVLKLQIWGQGKEMGDGKGRWGEFLMNS